MGHLLLKGSPVSYRGPLFCAPKTGSHVSFPYLHYVNLTGYGSYDILEVRGEIVRPFKEWRVYIIGWVTMLVAGLLIGWRYL